MVENQLIEYKLYFKRWIMLAVVVLVNFSNAMTWITFAPITFYTKEYYGNANAALIYNAVFMVLSIPMGFVAMYSVDKFGLRTGSYLGASLNLIGNSLRVFGSLPFLDKTERFYITLLGQCIAAIAQPFIMYLPTKLAAYWFPDSQRAIANTVGSMANPLGIAVMYATSNLFVNDTHRDNFVWLNIFVASTAVITAMLTFAPYIGVTSSVPRTPASASSSEATNALPFFVGFKKAIKSKTFLLLALALGGGVGLFNALYNNLQPALCVKGYSDTFSGLMGALLIVSGLIGSAVSGVFVDKTRKFEETMKVCFCVAGIAASSLSISLQHQNVEWWISLSIFCFGAFGFAIYPIGLELGVEVTYPVAEATSSGILIMVGQIQGVIYLVTTVLLARPASTDEMRIQTCINKDDSDADVQNWRDSFIAWNVIVVTLIIIFVTFFWPKYRRMQYEQGIRSQQVPQSSTA